tara:strand:+ start:218 stop:466 length:249 start_codon:yes stop_codon:yes gene_type:complete
MKDEKIIARIPRNANEELVIRTFEYWNIKVMDMRWFNNGNPTRKGLRVNLKEAETLWKAIKKGIGDENGNNKLNEDETESET